MNRNIFQWRSLKTRVTLFTLSILLIGIWALGFYASRMLREDMQRLLGEQQFSTVSFMAADINHELNNRLRALENVAGVISPAILGNTTALQTFLEQRPDLQNLLFNAGIMAYRLDGTVIAEVPLSAGRIGVNYMDIDTIAAALREGKTTIGRPVIGRKLQAPVIGMTAPIRNTQGKVIGALTGVINLGIPNFMDKISENRYGKTGGYLLVAPQYRLIVTASDKSRIMEALPAPGINPSIDRFIQGYEGSAVMVNPLGVEVLTSAKGAPVAGWIMSVLLPTAEAFAPIHDMQQRMLIATIFLTLLAGVLTWWMLRRQLSPMLAAVETLATMSDTNQPPQPLPIARQDEIGQLIGGFNRLLKTLAQREEALKESEFRWKFAIEGSGDGVWDWNIQTDEAKYSKRWKEMLGYAESDILPTNQEWVKRIHPDDQSYVAGAMQAYLDGKTAIYVVEYRLRCKDESYKWILGRGMVVSRSEDGRPLRMIGTHTDITVRKQMEDAREEALSRLQKIASRVPGVVFQFRLRADGSSCVPYASEAIREIYRVSPDEVRDDASPVFAVVNPDDLPEHLASIEASAKNLTTWHHEYRLKFEGEPDLWLLGNSIPQREADGSVLWHGFITDITERKQAEAKLVESESHLRTIIENEPECIKIVDAQGLLRQMNPAGLAMIEADSLEQVAGHPVLAVIAPEYHAAYARLHKRVLAGESMQMKYEVLGLKGGRRWMETHAVPMQDHGKVVHLAVTRDITERKQAEDKLHLAANVFTHAREGITITTADGTIIDVNDAFTRITGYSRDQVLGRNPRLLSSGLQEKAFYAALWRDLIEQGHWYGEVWNRHKNGELYAIMQTISAVRDAQGNTRQYVALFSDITPLKEHEKQLEHIAHYDALTTLPNRVLLADRMHQAMAQAQRRGQRLAVAYLDLDGFKAINDRYGHEAGDQLLMSLATRMKQALREGDTLARLGGDEFVAVLLDLADIEASVPMLARLLAAAAQPLQAGDLVLQVSASLGVTFYPQAEDVDADQLLRQADQAMYQAKLSGKNRYHVFDAEQDRSVRGHHESLERIRRALTEREFVLHYQPKVNMRTGTIIGAEALIRWQHPETGLLPPAAFLPVIEDHPLAIELGEWVIDSALTQMTLWHAAGLDIPVSVNVGARQLQQVDFVERLRKILAAHPNIRPDDLELEVLETSALEDLARVSQVIDACREIGVSFALDDFGTGYSSLTYLKRLPVTQLKIDQSFVRDMLDDPDDLAILEGVLALSTAFRRQVIAEGVETVEHGAMLLQLGCELAQGFGIARPMPGHELPGWSFAWLTDPSWGNLPSVSRDDLPLLFASVEHRAWIGAIASYLKGEREAPSPLAHHQCRFGTWLDAEGLARYGAQPSFQAIEPLHRQVHARAEELCELQVQGRNPEALARLGELHGLRDALLEQLKALGQESWQ